MRVLALVGGVLACAEWGYKAFDAMTERFDKKGRRSSTAEGLLNGVLEKET